MGLKSPKNLDLTPIWNKAPFNKRVYEKKFVIKFSKRKMFRIYSNKVWKLTELNSTYIKNINLRGFKSFHIDHKISIHYGFEQCILPKYIADISNLRMLSCKENLNKSRQCFVDDENQWILNYS